MSSLDTLSRLRNFNVAVQGVDPRIREESLDVGMKADVKTLERAIVEESIILRRERPVLAIFENETKLEFADSADSEIWKERLFKAKAILEPAIRAIGRVELRGGRLSWVGTGWLVADNIVVTNRHVANEFAQRAGQGFSFRMGASERMAASLDFLEEIGNPKDLVFKLVKVLHIEAAPGPDVAFFEIEKGSGIDKLASPIPLAKDVRRSDSVATIGYPAFDSRIPDVDLMERLYGKVYDKKRLAPGAVTRVGEQIEHNCTTLGGCSGAAVIDLSNGEALGLHFSGSFLATNYAVRADVVRNLLMSIGSGTTIRRVQPDSPSSTTQKASDVRFRTPLPAPRTLSITIPLTISLSLGSATSIAPADMSLRRAKADVVGDAALQGDGEEARPEDYADRDGYLPAFLGKGIDVPLPVVRDASEDVLRFEDRSREETELRYEHFSVVMSRSRRMCFFSAVNINGKTSKKIGKSGVEVGTAHSENATDHEGVLRQSPKVQSRAYDTTRGSGLGRQQYRAEGERRLYARNECYSPDAGIQRANLAGA